MPVAVAISLAVGHRAWWWVGALVIGYALAMLAGPTRASFCDGWRAMMRYRDLWLIPVALGVCYTTWALAVQVFYAWALPEASRPVFRWWQLNEIPAEQWLPLLHGNVLPAVELVAGLSTVFCTTYPVSAGAALLFLGNWHGCHHLLWATLRRRFGARGLLFYAVILICALAALAKPLAYAALPWWGQNAGLALLRASLGVDWLSFVFEALLGIGVQTYLILLAYLWVRGKSFTRQHLLEVTIRRFSVVLRWAWPVLLVSSLLMHLSHFLLTMPGPAAWMGPDWVSLVIERGARPALAVGLLLFFAVEITLVFHSESLRSAVRDNFRFLRSNGFAMLFFMSLAFLHLYGLTALGEIARSIFGANTLLGVGSRYLQAIGIGVLGGWLLASWSSLYHARQPTGARRRKVEVIA